MKPIIIEFHNTLPSLGTRLWPFVPKSFITKKDEKAWKMTIEQIKELITKQLPHFGYTSYRWDEKFDKTFITPIKDGKPLLIKKRDNLEHYEEEQKNLENFRTHIEQLLTTNIPLIYHSQLRSK